MHFILKLLTQVKCESEKRLSIVYEPRKASVNNRKDKAKNVSKNVTRMVIFSSLLNAFLQIPYSFFYIQINFDPNITYLKNLRLYSYLIYILGCCLPSLDIFCYYFFNRLFKKVCNRYFKRIFRLTC